MKPILLKALFFTFLFFMSVGSASATIETIKGSLACFVGCNKNVVQLIAQGEQHSFEVVGQFVDLSTAVEITRAGVSVSYGTRKGGSNSSIIVKFDVDDAASPGERTVKMRYTVETNGPDTFKVRVVKKGSVSQIQYKGLLQASAAGIARANQNLPRPQIALSPNAGGGATALTTLVPATDLPVNETVVLVVSGSKLDDVKIRPSGDYRNARILPGATNNRLELEIEFTRSGQEQLLFFDANLSAQDMNSSNSSKFSYAGGASRNVQIGGSQSSGGAFIPPPLSAGGGGGNTFVDVAPRANMLNIFRRQNQNPAFTENGVQYFAIDSQRFCNDMNGNQTKIITVPDLVWGVSNVGTANIAQMFAAQLKSNNVTFVTENIVQLNPGQTRDFTFSRQKSRVRVFTFLTRIGCFISPTADEYFEDPPFTVEVNINNALVEAAANQNNNIRNY